MRYLMPMAVLAILSSAMPAQAQTDCPGRTASDYASAPDIIHYRIYTDPKTGDSALEESRRPAKSTKLLSTGKLLSEYNFGAASKVQIVVGPPDLPLPMHPAPYKESFLVLEGDVVLELADGTKRHLRPGDMATFEDTDARRGHGGLTGACGYVALNIVP